MIAASVKPSGDQAKSETFAPDQIDVVCELATVTMLTSLPAFCDLATASRRLSGDHVAACALLVSLRREFWMGSISTKPSGSTSASHCPSGDHCGVEHCLLMAFSVGFASLQSTKNAFNDWLDEPCTHTRNRPLGDHASGRWPDSSLISCGLGPVMCNSVPRMNAAVGCVWSSKMPAKTKAGSIWPVYAIHSHTFQQLDWVA